MKTSFIPPFYSPPNSKTKKYPTSTQTTEELFVRRYEHRDEKKKAVEEEIAKIVKAG